jgi:hypothetical protein
VLRVREDARLAGGRLEQPGKRLAHEAVAVRRRAGAAVRTVLPRGPSRTSSNAAALMAPPFVRRSLPRTTRRRRNGYAWAACLLFETWVAALLVLSALALWAAFALEPDRLD